MVQCLMLPETINKKFAISSVEGEGPGQDAAKWQALFAAAQKI